MIRSAVLVTAGLFLSLVPFAAHTSDSDLAAPCAGCHAADDVQTIIPSLHGQSALSLEGKLRGYRSGERLGTVMNRIMRGYTEAEIVRLALALGTPAAITPNASHLD